MANKKYGPSIRNPESIFERETRRIAENFNTKPILDGVLVQNVALTTSTTRVAHQLGRPYKGFKVVDMTANGTVWRDSSDLNRPQDEIPLKASIAMTVSLWIF